MQKRMWYVTDTWDMCMRRVFSRIPPQTHQTSLKWKIWNRCNMIGRWWEEDGTKVPRCPQPSLLAFWDRLVSLRSCCFTACGHDLTFSGSCKTTALQGRSRQLRSAEDVSWCVTRCDYVQWNVPGLVETFTNLGWTLGWACVGWIPFGGPGEVRLVQKHIQGKQLQFPVPYDQCKGKRRMPTLASSVAAIIFLCNSFSSSTEGCKRHERYMKEMQYDSRKGYSDQDGDWWCVVRER